MKTIFINGKQYTVTDEKFDYIYCEQAKGKLMVVVDGEVDVVEYTISEDDLKYAALNKKLTRLTELTKDLAQVQAGLIIDDIEERKSEFRTLLNDVRVLQGKEPRNAIDSE